MADLSAATAADDTGIPADMIVDGEKTEPINAEAKEDASAKLLRELVAKHDQQMSEAKARMDEQGSMIRELLETNKAAETRGYARLKEEIEAKKRDAVRNADEVAFDAAERDLADLEKTRSPKKADPPRTTADAAKTSGAEPTPAVQEWIKANSWFTADEELNAYAIGANAKLIKNSPGMDERERLAEVTKKVKERFPDMFENPARKAPPAVNGSTTPPSNQRNKKTKTVADLDEHGKAALARLKRIDPEMTDEFYLKTYKWDA